MVLGEQQCGSGISVYYFHTLDCIKYCVVEVNYMCTSRNNYHLWVSNNSSLFATFLSTDTGSGSGSGLGMYYSTQLIELKLCL